MIGHVDDITICDAPVHLNKTPFVIGPTLSAHAQLAVVTKSPYNLLA